MQIRSSTTAAILLVSLLSVIYGCGGGGTSGSGSSTEKNTTTPSSSTGSSSSTPNSDVIESNATFTIAANGKYGAVEIRKKESITLKLHYKGSRVNAGATGQLVVADIENKVKYYNINQQVFIDTPTNYPLSTLQDLTIALGSNLPVGAYTYYFGTDPVANGAIGKRTPQAGSVAVYVVDSYAAPTDWDKVITGTNKDGDQVRFPANEVLIFAKKNASSNDMNSMIQTAGGTLSGHIPDLDLYVAKFLTTTQKELDAVISQLTANPSVSLAMYNFIAEQAGLTYPPKTDINKLEHPQVGCAFSDIDYMPGLALAEDLRSQLTFSPVRIAVMEALVDRNNTELSYIYPLINLGNLGGPFKINNKLKVLCKKKNYTCAQKEKDHGTAVLGIIAAADNGKGVSGLASRILKDKLRISVGYDGTLKGFLLSLERAKNIFKASIVNLSFGFKGLTAAYKNKLTSYLTNSCKGMLFIVAAPNDPVLLSDYNVWPTGISAPNIITVGGTALCKPTTRWTSSTYGNGIDIAAPAEGIPLIDTKVFNNVGNGNSFAAPMVTSLAAVMKSLDPSLTSEVLKSNILGFGYFIDPSLQLGKRRLTFVTAIHMTSLKYIGTLAGSNTAAMMTYGNPYYLLNSLYGEESWEATKIDSRSISGYGLSHPMLVQDTLRIEFGHEQLSSAKNAEYFHGVFTTSGEFKLKQPINGKTAITKDNGKLQCSSDASSVEFSECTILKRPSWAMNDVFYNKGYLLMGKGAIVGEFECFNLKKKFRSQVKIDFHKIIPVSVNDYSSYIEENCKGGISMYYRSIK